MIGDLCGGGATRSTIVRSFSFTGLQYAGTTPRGFLTALPSGVLVAEQAAIPSSPWQIIDYNDASGRLGGAPLTAAPAGGTLVGGTTEQTGVANEYQSEFSVAYVVDLPNPGAGGVVGKTKIAENTSPIPRDRLIFDYSYYDNVPLLQRGVNVNRFVLGIEKTFFDGRGSIEVKAPMATTLSSALTQDGALDLSHAEMGDLATTVKVLLVDERRWAVSVGLTVAAPTADDVRLSTAAGEPLAAVENHAVHVAPFVGGLWTPTSRFFAQGFLQYDIDTNGNPVLGDAGDGLQAVGRLQDTTDQYLDLGAGCWFYRSPDRCAWVRGMAATVEGHWNLALQETDVVRAGDFVIGDFRDRVETINGLVGLHVQLADRWLATLAYATPIGGGQDQEFDGELRCMVNYNFGRGIWAGPPPSL